MGALSERLAQHDRITQESTRFDFREALANLRAHVGAHRMGIDCGCPDSRGGPEQEWRDMLATMVDLQIEAHNIVNHKCSFGEDQDSLCPVCRADPRA